MGYYKTRYNFAFFPARLVETSLLLSNAVIFGLSIAAVALGAVAYNDSAVQASDLSKTPIAFIVLGAVSIVSSVLTAYALWSKRSLHLTTGALVVAVALGTATLVMGILAGVVGYLGVDVAPAIISQAKPLAPVTIILGSFELYVGLVGLSIICLSWFIVDYENSYQGKEEDTEDKQTVVVNIN